MISVIIPHAHNHEMLFLTLDHFQRQVLRPDLFEILVIDDANQNKSREYISQKYPNFAPEYALRYGYNDHAPGPAGARNKGAAAAKGEILLFIGDDCIPDRNLLWRHFNSGATAVQGLTLFHPQVMDSTFMRWLDRSGITANWASLKDGDKWKSDAGGFLLTTNWSIRKKDFFDYNGFNELFPNAAWEDVEMGHRLGKAKLPTAFDPQALNFHYHRHTVDTFVQRQIIEGRNRLLLCTLQPELAHQLLDPGLIRESRGINIEEARAEAKNLLFCDSQLIEERKYEVLGSLMQLASFKGITSKMDEEYSVLSALEHVHHKESPAYLCSAQRALKMDNYGFAVHCYEWLFDKQPDNWAAFAVAGEVELFFGNTEAATRFFEKAVINGPGEKWPMDRYNERATNTSD